MIQKRFFLVFQLFVPEINIPIRNTLERIHCSYAFSENDLKHEITLAKNLKESKLRLSLEQFLSFMTT